VRQLQQAHLTALLATRTASPPPPRRALDGELFFYGRVLGFSPSLPPDFEPIEIVNAGGA
jgi:hypothetical protein